MLRVFLNLLNSKFSEIFCFLICEMHVKAVSEIEDDRDRVYFPKIVFTEKCVKNGRKR